MTNSFLTPSHASRGMHRDITANHKTYLHLFHDGGRVAEVSLQKPRGVAYKGNSPLLRQFFQTYSLRPTDHTLRIDYQQTLRIWSIPRSGPLPATPSAFGRTG